MRALHSRRLIGAPPSIVRAEMDNLVTLHVVLGGDVIATRWRQPRYAVVRARAGLVDCADAEAGVIDTATRRDRAHRRSV